MRPVLLALLTCCFVAGAGQSEHNGGKHKDNPAVESQQPQLKQGLMAHYFKDPFEWDSNWKEGTAPRVQAKDWTFRSYRYTRKEPLINHVFVKRGWFSIRWVGYLKIAPANSSSPKPDETVDVRFELWMDDGARLFIDGTELASDWRPCSENDPRSHRRATVKLSPGFHRIAVEYFQGESLRKNDNDPAKLYWEIPSLGVPHQIVPASHLFHDEADESDLEPSQGLSAEDQQALGDGSIPRSQPQQE